MSYEDYMAERVFAPLGMDRHLHRAKPMRRAMALPRATTRSSGSRSHSRWASCGRRAVRLHRVERRGPWPRAHGASQRRRGGRGRSCRRSGWRRCAGRSSTRTPGTAMAGAGGPTPSGTPGSWSKRPTGRRYDVPIILEHSGSHTTYATGMVLLPDAGYGVVVLMNRNDEAAQSRFSRSTPASPRSCSGGTRRRYQLRRPAWHVRAAAAGDHRPAMALGVWWALRQLASLAPRSGLRAAWLARDGAAPRPAACRSTSGSTALAWWLVLDPRPTWRWPTTRCS